MSYNKFCFILFATLVTSSCKKLEEVAAIKTGAVEWIKPQTAKVNGSILDLGSGISEYGFCYSKNQDPSLNDFTSKAEQASFVGEYSKVLTDLDTGTLYYIKAFAISNDITFYGEPVSFTTLRAPLVTTNSISSITSSTAVSGGNVTSDGGSPVTSRGVCWSITSRPTIEGSHSVNGSGTGIFVSNITGLSGGTTYYLRAFAINEAGIRYGSEVAFTTPLNIIFNPNLNYGTLYDIDGNLYETIQIGSQIWMAENLRTTRYSNGNSIQLLTNDNDWAVITTPGYCWYNNDINNGFPYGALYNWYAVNTGILCPAGWHIPSDSEWTVLTNSIGDPSIAGGMMKETGLIHWSSPNTGATNQSGFTGLPGGFRDSDGTFRHISYAGNWWSSVESNSLNAWHRSLGWNYSNIDRYYFSKKDGFSVRCIKD